MILVAGGTGLLGRDVVGRLVARGLPVRVLTRDVGHGRTALGAQAGRVELVAGDVRDPATLPAVVAGIDTVIAAVHGFGGREAGGIAAVDRDGNRKLVAASSAAGVTRYVLLSIHDATVTDALALGRAKAQVEADLRATSMDATIIRPTAYMQTWAEILGQPILASGKARVFGGGRNPINFVSSGDVAAVVDAAIVGASSVEADGGAGNGNERGAEHGTAEGVIEVVGPEDLTFDAIVERFAAALGRSVPIAHVPLPILRAMALGLRPFRPVLADQVAAAIVLDTTDRRGGSAPTAPGHSLVRGATTFDEVIRTMVATLPTTAGAVVAGR